jgi:signal transduction histidine kinase
MAFRSIRPYLEGAALTALVTAVGFIADPVLRTTNIDMVYMLGVLVVGLRSGRGPATFTAVLSVVVFDFCFVSPYFNFAITDLAYLMTLAGFLVVGIATSELASRSRQLALEEAARARAEAKSEAKDEVLRRISHELRSPLTALLGWTQLADRSDTDPARLKKALVGIDHSGRLLARLVDDLMTASRSTSGKLTLERHPTALHSIIEHSVAGIAAIAEEKGVHVDLTIDPVDAVLGDEQRIEQITTNLLINAIKFTPSGGRVSVRLHPTDSDAELIVADSGIGIPAEFLPHVFEPFTQHDRNHAKHGLGLGMAIVNHLVTAHGGTVTVSSDGAGKGTTFTVRLPTIAAHPASMASGLQQPIRQGAANESRT